MADEKNKGKKDKEEDKEKKEKQEKKEKPQEVPEVFRIETLFFKDRDKAFFLKVWLWDQFDCPIFGKIDLYAKEKGNWQFLEQAETNLTENFVFFEIEIRDHNNWFLIGSGGIKREVNFKLPKEEILDRIKTMPFFKMAKDAIKRGSGK
ncbi:MAG: hypothetical protein V1698_00030 [bacterium]